MPTKPLTESYRIRYGIRFNGEGDFADESLGDIKAQAFARVQEIRAEGRKAFMERNLEGFYRVFGEAGPENDEGKMIPCPACGGDGYAGTEGNAALRECPACFNAAEGYSTGEIPANESANDMWRRRGHPEKAIYYEGYRFDED